MVHHFLQFLPDQASTYVAALVIAIAVAGAVLWTTGAAWSRYLVTLLTVLLGATIGMQMPRWFQWNISGAGPAVAAALLLGVTGFTVHGGWTGALLGVTASVWGAFILWINVAAGQPVNWPVVNPFTTFASYCQDWWLGLPPQVAELLPYTAGAAMISGLACAILWTRLTSVLAWSLTGATMLAAGALAAVKFLRPQWVQEDLAPLWAEVVIFALIVIVGAAIQWKLMGTPMQKSKRPEHARQFDRSPRHAMET